MPKVSVITPVYIDIPAKVDWLNEMIQSVIDQTFTDWELILIDDKSPVSYNLSHSDERIRFTENAENFGPCLTRNTAAALAESDCLLPLDSDDLLAANDVMERMYNAWQPDKSKVIFGNVQQYLPDSRNGFKRGKIFDMGTYTFERVMDLRGLIPVTAMHSINCHIKSGGWKAELTAGLEDVEYWIAAGERGFCGHNIGYTTLLYRRQDQTRTYFIKHISQIFDQQQQLIKAMHAPIYRGDLPMSCCGKSATNTPSAPSPSNFNLDPSIISAQNMRVNKITVLNGYDEKDLEWVAYQGTLKGSIDVFIRGPNNLPPKYRVLGTGHYFQIHKQHHEHFSRMQNKGYRMNQPDPRKIADEQPAPVVAAPPEPKAVELPAPPLSTLVRLDPVGSLTRQVNIVASPDNDKARGEVIVEPNPPQSVSDVIRVQFSLNDLGMGEKITDILHLKSWTVEDLANAYPDLLTKYEGIGAKRAKAIIEKARELITG